MDAMSAGTISGRPRSRANHRHGERAALRKNFRDGILRYSRNAVADRNERAGKACKVSRKAPLDWTQIVRTLAKQHQRGLAAKDLSFSQPALTQEPEANRAGARRPLVRAAGRDADLVVG